MPRTVMDMGKPLPFARKAVAGAVLPEMSVRSSQSVYCNLIHVNCDAVNMYRIAGRLHR